MGKAKIYEERMTPTDSTPAGMIRIEENLERVLKMQEDYWRCRINKRKQGDYEIFRKYS